MITVELSQKEAEVLNKLLEKTYIKTGDMETLRITKDLRHRLHDKAKEVGITIK